MMGGGGVQGNSQNKIFHGKCDAFLLEHKQEVPGPGWRDSQERAKKEMTETSLGKRRTLSDHQSSPARLDHQKAQLKLEI